MDKGKHIPPARKEALRRMADKMTPEARKAVQYILRAGGLEADFLAEVISKNKPGEHDSPANKAKNPVQTK